MQTADLHIHLDAATPPPGLLERLIRDGAGISQEILEDRGVEVLTPALLATAVGGGALFGLTIGLPGGLAQAAASALKFPLVLVGAAALTLPALYVSTALSGRRLRLAQLGALVAQALATAAVAMAALAPLAVVAWLTVSTFSTSDWYVYRRAVAAFTLVAMLGGAVGALRLVRSLPLLASGPWAMVFGVAGLQLTWLLRPVVGQPGEAFALLRGLESNGLAEVLVLLRTVLL